MWNGNKKNRILIVNLLLNNKIMNFKISFILSLIFLMFFSISSAQIDLGRIVKKAEKKVERKIDKKITKGIKNVVDDTDDAISGKNKKKKNKKGNGKTKIITETKIIKEVIPHAFRGEFIMNITRSDGDNMIKIALNEYQTAIRPLIIKEPNNLMIYDKKEETLISVNNIKYKGKAMKEWKFRDTEKRNNEVLTLTKTTEIKEIGGYIARKYIVEGKGIEGFMWLTKEIDADFGLICDLMGYDNYNYSKSFGFPLLIDITLKDGTRENISVNEIVENNYDSSLFDVSAYQLIDMTDLKPGK